MELSKQLKIIDRKFAYNTGKLPGFVGGTPDTLPLKASHDTPSNPVEPITVGGVTFGGDDRPTPTIDYGSVAAGAVGVLGNTLNSFMNYKRKDDFARNYGIGNVGGFSYTIENVNKNQLNAKNGKLPGFAMGRSAQNILGGAATGASVGAAFGPIGAVVGGVGGGLLSGIGSIFSEEAERDEYNKAVRDANNNTANNLNFASTQLKRTQNAQRYGLQTNLLIYGAKNGKLPGYINGSMQTPKLLHTINGEEIGIPNAKVEPREYVTLKLADGTIIGNRYDDGKIRTKRPGDILYTQTNDALTIWTNNKDPYTGIPFSDEAEARMAANLPLDDLQQRMAEQQAAKKDGKISKAKCGKLPGHAEGWLGNAIPTVFGSLASVGQMLSAYRNPAYRPNTYVSNPYEGNALETLSSLRVNPYPIINQLRSAEARTNRAVDIAGGLSGGQRTAARLAALNTTQNNISNLLSNIQTQNNAYKSAYAQAALTAGQQSRAARISANQWDYDMYAKAHAARNKGIQTGIANMLAQIQQYQANEFKRRQFNETMDLYRADLKQRNEHNAWMRDYYTNQPTSYSTRGVAPNPTKYDPVNPYTPIAPEPIKKYPWDYNRSLDYWNNLMNNKKGGFWR